MILKTTTNFRISQKNIKVFSKTGSKNININIQRIKFDFISGLKEFQTRPNLDHMAFAKAFW